MAVVHAVEKIRSTIQTILLTKTGGNYPTEANANVFGDRTRAVDQIANLPAINVTEGDDVAIPYSNIAFLDSTVEITTELVVAVKGNEVIDQTLNEFRRQLHKALMVDIKLGLPFVIMMVPAGAGAPEMKGSGNRQVCCMSVKWKVLYRTPIADPSVTA